MSLAFARAQTPPWHLWGSTANVRLEAPGGGAAPPESTHQLVKVNYGRPDTWHWLFACKITDGTDVPAAQQFSLIVRFDVTVGLGRSSTTIVQFESYRFFWGPGRPNTGLGSHIFSTEVYAPNRTQDPAPALQRDNVVRELVAQDIQVQAVSTLITDVAPGFVAFDVSAYFCPKTHIRPDWVAPTDDLSTLYRGGEIGGT